MATDISERERSSLTGDVTTAPPSNTVGFKPPLRGQRGREGEIYNYLVPLSKFDRPTLGIPGGVEFEWPLGTEGLRLEGSAALAIHRYLGGNAAVVEVLHYDEARITMTGAFPGATGADNMAALRDVVVAAQPAGGKILSLPGIFTKEQMVAVETYQFEHPEDNISDDSFNYSITFVRVGVGNKVTGVPPIVSGTPVGQPHAYVVTKTGLNTLRLISTYVWNTPNKWKVLRDLNKTLLEPLNIPDHLVPTYILPSGIKIYYS